jgi:hypothetical protein
VNNEFDMMLKEVGISLEGLRISWKKIIKVTALGTNAGP